MSREPHDPIADGITLPGGVRVPAASLRFGYARSSGPGGQNVNKVNTKVELWAAVEAIEGLTVRARSRLRAAAGRKLTLADEIHIESQEHRSQSWNRAQAVERLRDMILAAMHEPKVRRKTRPSRAAKERRLDSKRRRGEVKSRRRGGEE